ncbi:hypothetical protein [Nocardia brevicatena]|uniref:hypothetical protein n=1 Tax=Nocardia brevicatena TaxID=37327 RepID=UPI0002DDC32E|nr:hypothetical protein [Nocardia brevicatena]
MTGRSSDIRHPGYPPDEFGQRHPRIHGERPVGVVTRHALLTAIVDRIPLRSRADFQDAFGGRPPAVQAGTTVADTATEAATAIGSWLDALIARRRADVVARYAETSDHPSAPAVEEVAPDVLRFGLDAENLAFEPTAIGATVDTPVPLAMTAQIRPPDLPAYGRLLLDVLTGNLALSIRADEAEQAWRVLTPVLSAWSRNLVPLDEYPAGSYGPVGLDRDA